MKEQSLISEKIVQGVDDAYARAINEIIAMQVASIAYANLK